MRGFLRLIIITMPPIVGIALVRMFLDPVLPWIILPIQFFTDNPMTIACFVGLLLSVTVLPLLLVGLRLEYWLLPMNLPELNSYIEAQEIFIRYAGPAIRKYYFVRLTGAEAEREQRYGIPAPKRELAEFMPGRAASVSPRHL